MAKNKTFRVALLIKTTSYHQQVSDGFSSAAKKSNSTFAIDTYVTRGADRTLTHRLAKQIISKEYDLLVTVGTMCSQIGKHALEKHESALPWVFAGVTNPRELGIISSLEQPGRNISGVSMGFASYLTAAKLLCLLNPAIKHILLPYSPVADGGVLTNAAQLIKEYGNMRGITVSIVPIYDLGSVIKQIKPYLKAADALICLESCLINDIVHSLIPLCVKNKISLMASELVHAKKRAACAFGADIPITGTKAFEAVKNC